ncbi:hypothetical protein PWT90_01111 [Aphanocladium album]|nr:hypothetical protein PWT90_01111 [Aphanocladium album]
MPSFQHLIRFESSFAEDDKIYFTDLGPDADGPPSAGEIVTAYSSFDDLESKRGPKKVPIGRLLAPLLKDDNPIYCVGLNYHSHATEASLKVPSCPPLWTKPAASLAHPNEVIPINDFCAKAFLDYEGELVFVTSETCRDVSPEQAKAYILGYTVGNDLSCRKFQMPGNSGGQFFFAKAFDKFAPIGPSLISPQLFAAGMQKLVTKVNGEIRQTAHFESDMIFSAELILSHMSQGTTIPAGTAVMTGTPAGVGAFRKPKQFLQHEDVVEVEMNKIGTLRNEIRFE